MKFVYFIQTHKNPKQVYRLVRAIKSSSPAALIVVSHDSKAPKLDMSALKDLPGEEIVLLSAKAGRGDLSLIFAYLEFLAWIKRNHIEFDWLTNLSGQCYPTQPVSAFEELLATSHYDGFLEHFKLFSNDAGWGTKVSRDRYLFHYWKPGVRLKTWQRLALKPLKTVINNTQSLARIQWYNSELMLGLRTQSPFDANLIGYGGSYFHSLSRKCVDYLYETCITQAGQELIEFYRKTWVPVESLLQTILLNNPSFNLCSDNKRYISWSSTSYGHPGIVTTQDYPHLTQNQFYFARKIDMTKDSEILEMLDHRILPSRVLT